MTGQSESEPMTIPTSIPRSFPRSSVPQRATPRASAGLAAEQRDRRPGLLPGRVQVLPVDGHVPELAARSDLLAVELHPGPRAAGEDGTERGGRVGQRA